MTVHVDRYTKILLTILTILLFVLVIGLWSERPSCLPHAQAALPDSGRQLEQVITELQTVQKKIDRVYELLGNGKVKVQIVETPESKPAQP